MPHRADPSLTRRQFLSQSILGGSALGLGLSACGQNAARESSEDAANTPNGGRKLGVALCGLGRYATGQLGPALRETKHCRLTGVVTGDPEKGRRWAREYGFPESSVYHYDTIHQMVDNPEIDILYSVTPPGLHMRDALRGFEAGKHVIAEKPMALDAAQSARMIEAARQAGRRLEIGYRLHIHPYYRKLKSISRNGSWGAFEQMAGAFGFRSQPMGTWRLDKSLGGGPLMDLGVYPIYCAAMARGGEVPVAVTGHEPPKEFPDVFQEVEETLNFTLEYAGGAILKGVASWNAAHNYFRADAQGGWFEAGPPAYSYGGLVAETSEGPLPRPENFNQQAVHMDAFAEAVRTGGASPAEGELGLRDMRIIAAIFESARQSGKRVRL